MSQCTLVLKFRDSYKKFLIYTFDICVAIKDELLTSLQMKKIMQGHIEDMAEDKVVLGDTLESALEQGEKHELFATKCMEVREGEGEGGRGRERLMLQQYTTSGSCWLVHLNLRHLFVFVDPRE